MNPNAILDVLEKKNLLLLSRRSPGHPARDPVSIPTELFSVLSDNSGLEIGCKDSLVAECNGMARRLNGDSEEI
jgi:hypothetical protein